MIAFVLICCSLLSATAFLLPTNELHSKWAEFKSVHSKVYKDLSEELHRFGIFNSTLVKIEEHNRRFEDGLESYQVAVNKFSDLASHEFTSTYGKYRINTMPKYLGPSKKSMLVPKKIDWRKRNIVTDVKNQGSCGSCWAFSATGATESHHAITNGELLTLSEQQLIVCSRNGNEGCNGGDKNWAFEYMIKKGIALESDYPYEDANHMLCSYNSSLSALNVSSYVEIKAGDEEELKAVVAIMGPVSVSIPVTEGFRIYSTGYFYDPACSSILPASHDALIVGYGGSPPNEYWLVKNSWGPSWGEGGYIKMARNRNNHCGIANSASYPIISKN